MASKSKKDLALELQMLTGKFVDPDGFTSPQLTAMLKDAKHGTDPVQGLENAPIIGVTEEPNVKEYKVLTTCILANGIHYTDKIPAKLVSDPETFKKLGLIE